MALDQYVNDLPGLLTQAGLPTRAPHRFPWILFSLLVPVLALVGPHERRKAFKHLPRFLRYLREETYFDNQNAVRLLKSEGILLPDTQKVLTPILGYYVSQTEIG